MPTTTSRRVLASLTTIAALVGGMLLLPATAANAAEALDDSYENTSAAPIRLGFDGTMGSVVTANRTGSLVRFEFSGQVNSGSAAAVVYSADSAGVPQTLLATVPLAPAGAGWYSVVLPSPLLVEAGERFYIGVAGPDNSYQHKLVSGNHHPALWAFKSEGGAWASWVSDAWEMPFRTYIDSEPPTLTGTPPTTGTTNADYSSDLTLGGSARSVSVTSGSLPPGITLSETGQLRGAPTVSGAYSAVISSTANGQTATLTVPITVTGLPTAVQTLTATPGKGSAALNWTAPADGGNAGAVRYEVRYERADGVGESTTVTRLTAPTFTTTLNALYDFRFEVRSINDLGASPWSEVTVTPALAAGAPSVTGIPSDRTATITWTDGDNGGLAIVGHEVRRAVGGDAWSEPVSTDLLASLTTSLTNGTSYAYQVRAITDSARVGAGAWSNTATVVPRTIPGAPHTVVLVPQDGEIAASWSAPLDNGGDAVAEYQVLVKESGAANWPADSAGTLVAASGLTSAVADLENGDSYDVRVRARNAAGWGPWSSSQTEVPFGAPDAPELESADAGDTEIAIEWSAAFDGGRAISSYQVGIRPDGSQAFEIVAELDDPAAVEYLFEGLINGTDYHVAVRAVNEAGPGEWAVSEWVRPYTTATAPTEVTVASQDSAAELGWSAPEADGGYDVQGYDVEYRESGSEETTLVEDATSPTVIDGLQNGRGYQLRVRAFTAAGSGAWSTWVDVIPATVPDAPAAPEVAPIDGGLIVTAAEPEFDGGSALTGVDLQYREVGAEEWILQEGVSGLVWLAGPNGTAYEVQLRGVNEVGAGDWSKSTVATPRTVAAAPEQLALTAGDGTIVADWVAPTDDGGDAVSGYVVQHRAVGTDAWSERLVEGRTLISGLPNATSVEVRVAAVNAAGVGAFTEVQTATPFVFAPVLLDAAGLPLGNAELHPGETFRIAGDGGLPGAGIDVELHSEPVDLVAGTVSANGAYSLEATIPADIELGEHTVVVDFGAGMQTIELPVTVTAAPVEQPGENPGETPVDGSPVDEEPTGTDGTVAKPAAVTPATGLASTGSDAAGALAAASLLLIAGLGLAIRRRVRA